MLAVYDTTIKTNNATQTHNKQTQRRNVLIAIKESRKKSGKLIGLRASNMAVMLTYVSDGAREEVSNPAK